MRRSQQGTRSWRHFSLEGGPLWGPNYEPRTVDPAPDEISWTNRKSSLKRMFTQKRSEVQESPTHTKIQQTSGIFRFSASRGSITPKSESFCICRLGENHESLGGPRELSGVSMTSITTAFWAYGMTVIRRSGAHEGTHHMFPLPPKPRVFGVSLGVLVERRITSSLLEKETVIWNTKFFYKHPESNNFVRLYQDSHSHII